VLDHKGEERERTLTIWIVSDSVPLGCSTIRERRGGSTDKDPHHMNSEWLRPFRVLDHKGEERRGISRLDQRKRKGVSPGKAHLAYSTGNTFLSL
jgi:hypothetical protein